MTGDLSDCGSIPPKSVISSPMGLVPTSRIDPVDTVADQRRLSVVWIVLAAPAGVGLIAAMLALILSTDRLSSGSEFADSVLLGLALAMIAGSIALGRWHLCSIVRPLRQLAHLANAREHDASPWPFGSGVAREIALLRTRLEPAAAAALPERDRLTGLLSATGLREAAARVLDAAGAPAAASFWSWSISTACATSTGCTATVSATRCCGSWRAGW